MTDKGEVFLVKARVNDRALVYSEPILIVASGVKRIDAGYTALPGEQLSTVNLVVCDDRGQVKLLSQAANSDQWQETIINPMSPQRK
jgi:hypothetical protein